MITREEFNKAKEEVQKNQKIINDYIEQVKEYNENLVRRLDKICEDHGFTVTKRTEEEPEGTKKYEVKFIK